MAPIHIRMIVLTISVLVLSCFSCVASENGNLDASFLDMVSRALELASQVRTQDPDIMHGDFYIDGPFAALFSQQDQYCFLVFDSTQRDIQDWLLNADPTNSHICNLEGECCEARNGFRRAYTEPYYRDILESQVRACKQDGNEVVIAGHSQGGGIAPVGAVALADTDPTVIVFGAPGAINGDCPPLDVDNIHHFTNTLVTGGGSLRYDVVTSMNWRSNHYGNLYVMGDDPANVARYSHGEYPSHNAFELSVHDQARYQARIDAYKSTLIAGTHVGTIGFNSGYPCTRDDECQDSCVGGTCGVNIANDGGIIDGVANGGFCSGNDDCQSGRCEGYVWETGICEAKLGPGEECNEPSDCISNSCPWGFRRQCN